MTHRENPTIMGEIEKLGLNQKHLIGQGSDGFFSVSGIHIYNGVQKIYVIQYLKLKRLL